MIHERLMRGACASFLRSTKSPICSRRSFLGAILGIQRTTQAKKKKKKKKKSWAVIDCTADKFINHTKSINEIKKQLTRNQFEFNPVTQHNRRAKPQMTSASTTTTSTAVASRERDAHAKARKEFVSEISFESRTSRCENNSLSKKRFRVRLKLNRKNLNTLSKLARVRLDMFIVAKCALKWRRASEKKKKKKKTPLKKKKKKKKKIEKKATFFLTVSHNRCVAKSAPSKS
jgi:hypothetical protein